MTASRENFVTILVCVVALGIIAAALVPGPHSEAARDAALAVVGRAG